MIKNFIYLDEYKMYSMSSQVFEGVTEYLVSDKGSSTEKSESQKGPVASGRLLADILKTTNRISEKKYLHDYSYTLFEQHLMQEEKVFVLDEQNCVDAENLKNSLNSYSFIKVKSKALFNDIKAIKNILENFNDIGSSLALVANFEEFSDFKCKLQPKTGKPSKLKGFSGASHNLLDDAHLQFARSKGMYKEPDFLEGLRLVLDYGFHDQLELQLRILDFIFSADLNRNYLRESDDLIIRKYSRRTEKEFIVFGIVTQSNVEETIIPEIEDESESMKSAVLNIVNHLTDLELSFTRKLVNEIKIDPIAVYTEL